MTLILFFFIAVTIKPICLPQTAEDLNRNYDGENCTVVGWGRTENGTSSDKKLKVAIPVVPLRECSAPYRNLGMIVSSKQICAGGQADKDSCNGDSGGPLMREVVDSERNRRWMQLGLVSYGTSRCGQPGFPGVYTRISEYMDWIVANIKP